MLRHTHFALLILLGLLSASGCALPDYYTPGGYSSTYHRRLEESTVAWADKPSFWKSAAGRCRKGLSWISGDTDRRDRHVARPLELSDMRRPY